MDLLKFSPALLLLLVGCGDAPPVRRAVTRSNGW